MMHYVYILRCADNTLYTGYTTDVSRRVEEHNGLTNAAGAKYTQPRRPVELVHQESFTSRSAAMQREAAIKRLTRVQKEKLLSLQKVYMSFVKKN